MGTTERTSGLSSDVPAALAILVAKKWAPCHSLRRPDLVARKWSRSAANKRPYLPKRLAIRTVAGCIYELSDYHHSILQPEGRMYILRNTLFTSFQEQ